MKIGPLGEPILASTEVHGPWTAVLGVMLNYMNAGAIASRVGNRRYLELDFAKN
jgi:hypothetical protein